jgi:Uma2 family endonuclease
VAARAPETEPRPHRYVREPEPLVFAEEDEVPETNTHLELRTALYLILKHELSSRATIGSDQFVYWDPTDPGKRLAPDAFVRLGPPHAPCRSWKTWERGAPDLAVEITSASDETPGVWEEKLVRYRASGIREVVRFDPGDAARPIRVWDHVDGDLVERAPDDADLLACTVLGLWWAVRADDVLGPTLRLTRDAQGKNVLPTPEEALAEEVLRLRAALAAKG